MTGYCEPDKNGYRYMYRCLVLTGDFTAGKIGIIEPPLKSNEDQNLSWYHSAVDDVESPTMFVIFCDNQTYPQYLITFQ